MCLSRFLLTLAFTVYLFHERRVVWISKGLACRSPIPVDDHRTDPVMNAIAVAGVGVVMTEGAVVANDMKAEETEAADTAVEKEDVTIVEVAIGIMIGVVREVQAGTVTIMTGEEIADVIKMTEGEMTRRREVIFMENIIRKLTVCL